MTSKTTHYNWLTYIIAFLCVSVIACFFRLYPLREFKTDDSKEKATVYIISQLKKTAAQQVDKNYPQASEEQKRKLTQKHFDTLLYGEKETVMKKIDKLSQTINDSSDSKKKTPYLLASDSFYYYHLTDNIVKTGKISNTIKGSKYLHTLMLAPHGHWEPLNLHPYIGFFIFKTLSLIDENVDLAYAVSFTPLLICLLSLLVFCGLCRNINCHPAITFTSAVFLSCAPIFIRRSTFGWYDNDPYNVFFPILIFWLLFRCIDIIFSLKKDAKPKHLKLFLNNASLFVAVALYSLFWHGWMLMFVIIATSLIAITLYSLIVLRNSLQTRLSFLTFITFSLGAFLIIGIIFGFGQFFTLFQEGWIALKNFLTPQLANWPDLYISVGELSSSTLNEIITAIGGLIPTIITGFGILFSLLALIKLKKNIFTTLSIHPAKIIIVLVALCASILITLGAERFAILCLGPIYILFAIALNTLFTTLRKLHFNKKALKIILPILLIIGLIGLSFFPIKRTNTKIKSYLNPIYNDTWDNALTYLRDNTPTDSIINTWWPPGHFIKATANRRVTFDGASINYPQAYWMANIYLSQSEDEALGYLRMLNNSGNDAVDYFHNELDVPLSTTVFVLKQITQVDELKARVLLSKVLKDKEHINNIINMTHRRPPPTYLLLYNEFVENNVQLAFIGNWNFERIEEINKNPELIAQVPNRNSDDYVEFLWDLNGGRTKYSGLLPLLTRQNKLLTFQENIRINTETMSCVVASPKYGKGIPQSIFFLKKGKIVEKKLVGANLGYSIVLDESGNKPVIALMDRSLANSLMMKLYFFDGAGLKYIKPFHATSDLTKRTEILLFEVNWNQYYFDFINRIKTLSGGN